MSNLDHDRMSMDALVAELVRAGAEVRGRAVKCPWHDDRHASGSIYQDDGGVWRFKCMVCEVGGDVFDLRAKNDGKPLADVLREAHGKPTTQPARGKGNGKRPPTKVYATLDEAQAVALAQVQAQARSEGLDPAGVKFSERWQYTAGFFIARFDLPETDPETGKPRKSFRPLSRNGNGWSVSDPPGPLPLYGADKLPPTGPVFLVEGERKVDALRKIGLPAVTSAHGAKSPERSDWRPVAGRELVGLPDHDEAGTGYMDKVGLIVTRLSPPASVRAMVLPGLPPKGDVVDFLGPEGPMDGKTSDECRAVTLALAEAAPNWTAKPAKDDSAILPVPVLTCLADVKPQEVRWLWPDRIALGKLTVLTGDPDLGKSLITLDMATRVSRGNRFPLCPDGGCEPGGVVLLSAEDDAADTIVPRLLAAGADLDRIKTLDAVRIADRERAFNLDDDLPALEAAIRQVAGCRLVIIDPISAYLGRGIDSHRNAEVRAVLAPLGKMAARHGVALVAVAHLNKGQGPAMYRTSGSLGFVAAARSVYVFGKDRDDPTGRRRFMLRVKNNLTADLGGLAYRLDATESTNGQPVVCWEPNPVTITADEALRTEPERAGGDGVKEREAADWLRAELAQGPRRQKDILDRAAEDCIKEHTLYRAKADLKVQSFKDGYGAAGVWYWRLPPALEGDGGGGQAIDCQASPNTEPLATFGQVGNLWEKPKENEVSGAPPEAPDAKGCQAPETGNLCPDRPASGLDPDRPGPTDLLTKAQYRRYRAVYDAHNGEPGEKHAAAWRAAVAGGKE